MTDFPRRSGGFRVPGAVVTALALAVAVGLAALAGQNTSAIAFAAGVTLLGLIGSWLAARWPTTTPAARVTSGLATVALRILPALVALGWLQAGGTPLRDEGAGELLVMFYLTALAVEITRTIMASSRRRPEPGAASRI